MAAAFTTFSRRRKNLLLAVLDRHAEMLWPMVMEPVFARAKDPIERIFALLAAYREWMVMTDCTYVCPIGRLALEVESAFRECAQKIAANFDGWRAAVSQCLEEAKDRLPTGAEIDPLARFVLTVMEGGLMQSRSQRDIGPYDDSVAQLRTYSQLLLKRAAR